MRHPGYRVPGTGVYGENGGREEARRRSACQAARAASIPGVGLQHATGALTRSRAAPVGSDFCCARV